MPVSDPAPAESSRDTTVAITCLALAAFAALAMVRVTDSLLPQIADDLKVTVGAASIAVTVYSLSHACTQLVVGPIGDRFGKYRCIVIGAAISTLFTLICAMVQSLPALVAARLICGLSAGWIIPLAVAYVGDVIPYERRQPILARFLSGQIAGQLFGQVMGGVLGDWVGWRVAFVMLSVLFAVSTAAVLYQLLRNPVTRHRAAPDGEPRPPLIASYRAVLHSPWSRFILVMSFLENFSLFGALAFIGAYLHFTFGLSFSLVGLFVGIFALGGLLYTVSVKVLLNALGMSGMVACAGLLLAVAYVGIAITPVWWTPAISTLLIGFGFYMLHNTLQTFATQMAPAARGTAVSLFSAAMYLGQTAGVAAAGLVFDQAGGAPIFAIAGALLLLQGLWFSVAIKRRMAA